MEKIISRDENSLNLDVYINGWVDINLIPKEILESLVANLERDISESYKRSVAKKLK